MPRDEGTIEDLTAYRMEIAREDLKTAIRNLD